MTATIAITMPRLDFPPCGLGAAACSGHFPGGRVPPWSRANWITCAMVVTAGFSCRSQIEPEMPRRARCNIGALERHNDKLKFAAREASPRRARPTRLLTL